ncbi:MAG: hypothetical protein AAGI07_18835, partial [Bacteroidota bacterium]
GSGILKDTITIGCLGWMTYCFYNVVLKARRSPLLIILFMIAALLTYLIKKYILLSFLPALLIWITAKYFSSIRHLVRKALIAPVIVAISVGFGYLILQAVGGDDSRYALSNIARTAQITAYDIRYGWGARLGDGSGYTLGDLDGTFGSMIRLAPKAVNVSLFRPYLWEIKNPLMLLSGLEALLCLFLTLWVIYKISLTSSIKNFFKPEVLFCMAFSLVFAFAVGISTYNFGTLARYKIPLLPFYFSGLVLLYYYGKSNNSKKFEEFDSRE